MLQASRAFESLDPWGLECPSLTSFWHRNTGQRKPTGEDASSSPMPALFGLEADYVTRSCRDRGLRAAHSSVSFPLPAPVTVTRSMGGCQDRGPHADHRLASSPLPSPVMDNLTWGVGGLQTGATHAACSAPDRAGSSRLCLSPETVPSSSCVPRLVEPCSPRQGDKGSLPLSASSGKDDSDVGGGGVPSPSAF